MNANVLGFQNVKLKKLFLIVLASLLFATSTLFLIFMLCGVVDKNGLPVSIIESYAMMLNVINLNGLSAFEYILRLALGIIYNIFTAIIIKNAICAIAPFIKAVFKRGDNDFETSNAIKDLINIVGSIIKFASVFMLLAMMISSSFTINGAGVALFVISAIDYILVSVALLYLRGHSFGSMLYRGIANLLFVLIYALLLSIVMNIHPAENIVTSFITLFGGFYGDASLEVVGIVMFSLATPVLLCVLQGNALAFVSEVWGGEFYKNSKVAESKSLTVMVLSIILFSFSALASLFFGIGGAVMINESLALVNVQLPLLITSVVMFVAYKAENFSEKAKNIVVEQPAPAVEVAPVPVAEPVVEVAPAPVVAVEEQPAPVAEPVAEVAPAPVAEPVVEVASTVAINNENIELMKKYKELLDSGIITQEEFNAKRKELLGL